MMTRQHQNGHDKFRKKLSAHLKDMEGMLEQREAAMGQKWSDLDQGWANLEQKMSEVGMSMRSPNTPDPVLLNVGGSDVYVPRFVLEGMQGYEATWTLGDLFGGGEWDNRLLRDSDGHIFLDESPACFQHLINNLTKRLGSARACLDLAVGFRPDDEPSYLLYVAGALGLPPGMTVRGGSTVVEADEANVLTNAIQGWCPDEPTGLELLYRASRDGWSGSAFHAKICTCAPTLTLARVRACGSNTSDSVVGAFSSVSWDSAMRAISVSPGVFLFMLKDGGEGGTPAFQPVKWVPKQGITPQVYCNIDSPTGGPVFGTESGWDFNLVHSPTRFEASNNTFDIPSTSPYLALHGRPVVDYEVFRVCSNATAVTPPLPPPPAGDSKKGLIDCEATLDTASTSAKIHEEDDVQRFGSSFANSLKSERTALLHARAELVQANARATASSQALAAVYGPDIANGKEDAIIELSISGLTTITRMTTLLSTLQTCHPEYESVLAVRFERWSKIDKDKDVYGRWPINDCSPPVFAKLLDVLRMKKRAGWESGDKSQVKGSRPVRVAVKGSDRESFEELVDMYFPGCQSFILDNVDFQEESPAS